MIWRTKSLFLRWW